MEYASYLYLNIKFNLKIRQYTLYGCLGLELLFHVFYLYLSIKNISCIFTRVSSEKFFKHSRPKMSQDICIYITKSDSLYAAIFKRSC